MDSAAPQAAEHRTLRSFFIDGPAGRLEALLDPGHDPGLDQGLEPGLVPGHEQGLHLSPTAASRCAVVLAHPHPLGGGSMHNKVVYHAARVFRDLGWPTLRFNFRGVGLSEGTHDGHAEAEDFLAALNWLSAAFSLPVLAAGFSFGAAMMLAAASARSNVAACLALGLPLHSPNQRYTYPQLAHWRLPTLFLSGERDVFASPKELAAAIKPASKSASEMAELQILPDADHFFTGHLQEMQQAIRSWLDRKIVPSLKQATGTETQIATETSAPTSTSAGTQAGAQAGMQAGKQAGART